MNSYVIIRFGGAEKPTASSIAAIVDAAPVKIKFLDYLESATSLETGTPVDAGWGLFEAATPADATKAISFFAGARPLQSKSSGLVAQQMSASMNQESTTTAPVSSMTWLADIISGAENSHGRVGVAAMPDECRGNSLGGSGCYMGQAPPYGNNPRLESLYYAINAIRAPILWKRFPSIESYPKANQFLINYFAPEKERFLIAYGRKRMTIIDTGVDWEHEDLDSQVSQEKPLLSV